jgi:hypothetical protein
MQKKGGFFWLRTQSTVKSSNEHETEGKKRLAAEWVLGVHV